jgi:hypothetical protein
LHIGASVGIPGVGIYTSTPNKELTVVGEISATSIIYASGGNSNNWNTASNTVSTYSPGWQNAADALNFIIQNSNFNAIVGRQYLVDTTSSNVVGILPASPVIGDSILFIDSSNTWETKPLILDNNGNLLQTFNEPLTANISGYQFQLVYIGGSYGWKII